MQLKIDHSGSHVTFLDLYVIIKDCIVIYNSLKKRHIFIFHCKDENVRISVIFLVAKCFA